LPVGVGNHHAKLTCAFSVALLVDHHFPLSPITHDKHIPFQDLIQRLCGEVDKQVSCRCLIITYLKRNHHSFPFGFNHGRDATGKADVCSCLSLTTMSAIKQRISAAKTKIRLHSVIGRQRYQTRYFIKYHSCFQGLTSFAGT